nr:L,D-transpeptidase family protein [uncultured Flavobacterium sp.]
MKKATYLLGLMALFCFVSGCRNAAGGKEMAVSHTPVNTAHLKNTSHTLTDDVISTLSIDAKAFYTQRDNSTVWINKENRQQLIDYISNVANDGLQPEDYHYTYLKDFEALKSITEEECIRYDVMLTEAFLSLSTHLFKGKLTPNDVYSGWALNEKPFDAEKLLTQALEQDKITDALQRCRPRHAVYQSLCNSLTVLNALPDDKDLPKVILKKKIRKGDSSETVGTIQQRLLYWGDLKTDSISHTYDTQTIAAVKHFQARHGLRVTGKINDKTTASLNVSRAKRIEQVVANLERWRWYAYDLGEKALLINIPDFKMAVVENGKDTVQTYNVVVGKPERKTPVLQSAVNAVILNPTWTVPPTIIKEDLTPAATKNRTYFANHNMKIYRDTNEVSAEDWVPAKYNNYRYVQAPGYNNSLGLVKFNFNSKYSVYLHDTNHRDLFGLHNRALSSGCVRVENPLKLAEYVLANQNKDWNRTKIDSITAGGETTNVYIKKSIRVHQLYWTAWMDKNGLQFRDDIYSLDKTLYNKLRQDL